MARTLSEVYAGMLSRDWPRLLEILESGDSRVVIYRFRSSDEACDSLRHLTLFEKGVAADSNRIFAYNEPGVLSYLEQMGIGWLPAPGDNPIDIIKSQYRGYMEG